MLGCFQYFFYQKLGPALKVAPRDTLLLGTDGLFDNLRIEEIVDIVRAGPLARVVSRLASECRARMCAADDGQASKPDDLTFVLARRSRAANGAS